MPESQKVRTYPPLLFFRGERQLIDRAQHRDRVGAPDKVSYTCFAMQRVVIVRVTVTVTALLLGGEDVGLGVGS
jgi:hypothetical protein